ncbi:MAG: NAD(P)-binding protein [Myxococcales bacterium]|nr:NAD(P)-binding protein [Myxococcales bacterium]
MSTRREMLRLLLGAPFAAELLACEGAAPPPGPPEGALLGPDVALGHRLREPLPRQAWDDAPTRRVGVAIVGGGPAGLSAGWRLARRGERDLVVLDLEPAPGGTSRSGRSPLTAYPWGAHYLPLPPPSFGDLYELLGEMGAADEEGGREEILVREPQERVFYRGYWYPGLYPYAGASAEDLDELARFERLVARYVDGGAFDVPLARSVLDPALLALDEESAAAFLDRHGLRSPRLRWLAEYATRDDYGLSLQETSAWAFVYYWASRGRRGDDALEGAPFLTWPEGNGALVAHLAGALGERVETGKLAAHVYEEPRDDGSAGVHVLLLDAAGQRERLLADRAILALPRFVAARVAPELQLTREGFEYGAWAVAALHLDERPAERGFPPAWDNVLYGSPSLGYVTATHQRGRDHGPTVWSWYLPFVDADADAGRRRLFAAEHRDLADACMRDLRRAHPDLDARVRQLDIWRWGHGMVQPRVGFLRGGARLDEAAPRGAIHLAHTDLSGLALFVESFAHGVRAADEVWLARRPLAAR